MPEKPRKVLCSNCKFEFDEPDDLPYEDWKPCPFCGQKRRMVVLTYSEKISLHEKYKLKTPKAGHRHRRFESEGGDDYSVSRSKFLKKIRIIDRKNDWYEETIIDPDTNEIIHQSKEPLSKHLGHGSDKK